MPRTRWRSTTSEKEEGRACLQRLKALGIPVGTMGDVQAKAKTLRLRQIDPEFARVYDLPNGEIAVVAACELTGLKSGVTVCDCEMTPPWDGPELYVLSNPNASLGCEVVPQYEGPSHRILNHWLTDKVTLRCGQVVAGLVIAIGSTSIPEKYCSGMPAIVELSIRDQFDNDCRLYINVEVDRSPKQKYLWRRTQRAAPHSNGHRGLFAPVEAPKGDDNDVSPRWKHGTHFAGAREVA